MAADCLPRITLWYDACQGPSTTCDGDSKKILCLPPDYSKFDLPYRNDFNIIDIGENAIYSKKLAGVTNLWPTLIINMIS